MKMLLATAGQEATLLFPTWELRFILAKFPFASIRGQHTQQFSYIFPAGLWSGNPANKHWRKHEYFSSASSFTR